MKTQTFWFFLGSIITLTVGIIISFFRYTWIIKNIHTWAYILLTSFLISAILVPISIFLIRKLFIKYTDAFSSNLLATKDEILSSSLRNSLGESAVNSATKLTNKVFDYFSNQRFKAFIIRSYLILFAGVLGSVGTILLYNQNELIKEQNEMLLKQYKGFQEQLASQVGRWEKEDQIKFEAQKTETKEQILNIQREVYIFSIDMASLEKELYSGVSSYLTIANRIFDLSKITIDAINVDEAKDKNDLANINLEIAKFLFFFEPVNDRLKVMRSYPISQQKGIIRAWSKMLTDTINKIKARKAIEASDNRKK